MGNWSRFNITSIVLGFAFLYLPIVLLVIFSFNDSKLVTVWGGFSTKWYVSLFHNQGLMDAAWVTAARRRHLGDRRDRARHAGRAGADPLHALPRPRAVFRHGVRAAGHAGGHHRPVAAAAVRGDRPRPRLPDGHARPHHLHHVLRRRRRAVAADDLRPLARGSGDGSRRDAGEDLLPDHAAGHRCRPSCRAGCWPSRCRSTIW